MERDWFVGPERLLGCLGRLGLLTLSTLGLAACMSQEPDSPIAIAAPNFIDLEVVKTDPGLKGDTAQGGSKPATLATGAVVQVPLFIVEGELLRIDTRSGEYVSRAKS